MKIKILLSQVSKSELVEVGVLRLRPNFKGGAVLVEEEPGASFSLHIVVLAVSKRDVDGSVGMFS